MTMIEGQCRPSRPTSATIERSGLQSLGNSASDNISLHLSFTVSRDEEHVQLRGVYRSLEFDLGERVHHYPLLLLVRLRAQDLKQGQESDSAGWIAFAPLAKMLGLDVAHLHIQLFRLRQQIGAAMSLGQPSPIVMERRRGQVRAAAMSVRIAQGATVRIERLSDVNCFVDWS